MREDNKNIFEHLVLNTYPQEWVERYKSQQYLKDDPVYLEAIEVKAPFIWSKALSNKKLTPRANQIMKEAAEFGIVDGYSIPVQLNPLFKTMVVMTGEPVTMDERKAQELQLIALALFHKARKLFPFSIFAVEQLSAREREILSWTSFGASAQDIAAILGLSETTITTHINNTKKKLHASNKTHAVATALRQNLI